MSANGAETTASTSLKTRVQADFIKFRQRLASGLIMFSGVLYYPLQSLPQARVISAGRAVFSVTPCRLDLSRRRIDLARGWYADVSGAD